MRFVDIEIFHIGQTKVNSREVMRWMEFLGTSKEFRDELDGHLDDDGPLPGVTNPALLIALAAKRCYMSFEPGMNPNVTKVRSEWTSYLDNVMKQKHGSVLEHAVHNFAFENVSRVFTGEMNRHRAGVAVSEGSMRYIRYTDIPMWLPTSLQLTQEEHDAFDKWERLGKGNPDISSDEVLTAEENKVMLSANKKQASREVFRRALHQDETNYNDLQKIWAQELSPESNFTGKKHITSMMRRIIPMGVATGGVWSLNIRALRHVMALRASAAAEEEILEVWSRAGKIMVESEPTLMGDFTQTPEGYWVPKYEKV